MALRTEANSSGLCSISSRPHPPACNGNRTSGPGKQLASLARRARCDLSICNRWLRPDWHGRVAKLVLGQPGHAQLSPRLGQQQRWCRRLHQTRLWRADPAAARTVASSPVIFFFQVEEFITPPGPPARSRSLIWRYYYAQERSNCYPGSSVGKAFTQYRLTAGRKSGRLLAGTTTKMIDHSWY